MPSTTSPRRGQTTIAMWVVTAAVLMATQIGTSSAQSIDNAAGVLFREGFDDARLPERGWYDGQIVRHLPEGCPRGRRLHRVPLEAGHDDSGSSSALRRLFEPTDTVYVRFSIKLSPGWGWTGRSYHPHLMHFLTTENDKYHGPAASHLTMYIEPQEGKLRLAAQDIQNRDTRHGLTQGPLRGGYNGTFYDSKEALFTDDAWHCVEAMFRLNTLDLERDRPNADGIVRAWFDGKLVVERTDVILRSTDFPNMKFNQFLLAPYFGPGLLPHEQTLWIDELAVGTKRLGCHHGPGVASERQGADARRRGPAQEPDDRLPAEALRGPGPGRSVACGTGAARPQGRSRRLRRPGAAGGHPWPAQVGVGEPGGSRRGTPRGREANARPARQGGGGPPHVPGRLQRRHREGRPLVQHRVPARSRRQGDRPLPQGQPAAEPSRVAREARSSRSSPRRTWERSAC